MKKLFKNFLKIALVILVINLALGGVTLQYTLNYWMPKITPDTPTFKYHAEFLPCAVVGLFVGQFSVPAAAVTWLIETSGHKTAVDKKANQ
ncbi:MAG: hypothetical protein WCO55_03510 [Candidatus Falkowbacteria bacterium]